MCMYTRIYIYIHIQKYVQTQKYLDSVLSLDILWAGRLRDSGGDSPHEMHRHYPLGLSKITSEILKLCNLDSNFHLSLS